jgi:small conductance mechanosensitive channel
MIRVRIHTMSTELVAFLLLLLLAGASSAADPQPTSKPQLDSLEKMASLEAAAPVGEAANPKLVRIEEIRASLMSQRAEILALEAEADAAGGYDAVALRSMAIEMRLTSADAVGEMVRVVLELESEGVDVALYRRQLSQILPRTTNAIHVRYESIETSLAQLTGELATAGEESKIELAQRIQREDALIGRILTLAIDQAEMLDSLDLPSDIARNWLREEMGQRARLLSGRIHLSSMQLTYATERLEAAPDEAAIKSAVAAARARLETSTARMSALVDLMEQLEMDTARYRQRLIESTGEITVDVLDRRVAGDLLSRWLEGATESVVEEGPRVVFKSLIFALVVVLFWSLSRFVSRVMKRVVDAPHLRFSELLKRMIVSMTSGIIMLIGLLLALSQLGFEVGPMLAGLGIAGFVLGFALQETLGNFAAGVMILAYRPYDVGDLIECSGDVFGKVSAMNLVSTTILTLDNQTRVVPNGKIWGDVITNVTAQRIRRVDLTFGISYTDDIPHAEEVLWSIVKEHPMVLDDPPTIVKVHELGDSSVNLIVRPWVSRDDYWDAHWDITREVKLRFDREGISIPFPQRDVHLPAGVAPPVQASASESGHSPLSSQALPESDA